MLTFECRTVYGSDLYYPVSEPAHALCGLARRETLYLSDLRELAQWFDVRVQSVSAGQPVEVSLCTTT